jgi:hypothetical protein
MYRNPERKGPNLLQVAVPVFYFYFFAFFFLTSTNGRSISFPCYTVYPRRLLFLPTKTVGAPYCGDLIYSFRPPSKISMKTLICVPVQHLKILRMLLLVMNVQRKQTDLNIIGTCLFLCSARLSKKNHSPASPFVKKLHKVGQ